MADEMPKPQKLVFVPLRIRDEQVHWPVTEAEYEKLMQMAEKQFGERPVKMEFLVEFPPDRPVVVEEKKG